MSSDSQARSAAAPARFNFVRDVVEPLARSRPHDEALIALNDEGVQQVVSFADVARLAADAGDRLAEAGARPGDAVMTMIGSRPEWVAAILGTWRIGAVALPCNEMLRSHDLALRLSIAQPAAVVAAERNLPELEPALEATDARPTVLVVEHGDLGRPARTRAPTADTAIDDPAMIIFTSGTTGEPRPVTHVQRYLWGQHVQSRHWVDARPADVAWCTASPGWSKSTRNSFVAPWLMGAAAVVCDARFDAEARLALAAEAGVTVLCQAPTEYRLIAKASPFASASRGSLRHLISAGEPLNPEVIRAFHETLGLAIHDSYGQTETGALTAMPPGKPVREGSMGKPLPGFELDIRDGELCVRAPSVPTIFPGYRRRDGADPDWYFTGDRASRGEDGYLWFEGRGDDIIISAGYRIGPFEVESALVEHPSVAEAAAVGVPDAERGSIVKAFVVTGSGEPGSPELAATLQEHVRTLTAPYKYPRQIEFVDELPKTASGKIKRAALRERSA